MNGTAHVIVPATVTEIGDGPYIYASCQQCYSKLFEVADVYSCSKCGKDVQPNKVAFRYRLKMTITDSTTFVMVTAFGAMLNPFFGCPASEFFKKWIKIFQERVGNLEQSIMKWAVEETFVGSHLHFGFRIPSSLVREQKKRRNSGISLRDIQAGNSNKKSISWQADHSLVATQVIVQNTSQSPPPVTLHLQNVFSAFDNLIGSITYSHWFQVRQFFEMKYARHGQSMLSHTSLENTRDMQDCTSVIASLDQTSIAFSCSDRCRSPGFPERVTRNTSHCLQTMSMVRSRLSEIQSTNSVMTSNIQSEKNSEKNNHLYASATACKSNGVSIIDNMSSLCISNVEEFDKEYEGNIESNVDDQDSILLFDDSASLYEEIEVPLSDTNITQGHGSSLVHDNDLSGIEDDNIREFPSDRLNFSFNLDQFGNESDFHLSPCQLVDYVTNVQQPGCELLVANKGNEIKTCTVLSHDAESECNKYIHSNRKPLSLKNSNLKCKISKNSISVLVDKSKNEINSHHTIQAVNHSSHLDMPESEDLNVFLNVANHSTTQDRLNNPSCEISAEEHAALVCGEQRETSSMTMIHDMSGMDSFYPIQTDNHNSLLVIPESENLVVSIVAANHSTSHCGLNGSGSANSVNMKDQSALLCEKWKAYEKPIGSESDAREEMTFASIFHNGNNQSRERSELEKDNFLKRKSKNYNRQVEAVLMQPLSANIEQNHVKDTDFAFKVDDCDFAIAVSSEDPNASPSNISCDLFSSQDSMSFPTSHSSKRLSRSTNVNIFSETTKVAKHQSKIPVKGVVGIVDSQITSSLSHNQSYDLFSTPSSINNDDEVLSTFNHCRPYNNILNTPHDSFDLFSSEDEM